MSDQMRNHVDAVLQGVSPSRRDFLRNLLMAGAAAAAFTFPASQLLAEGAGGGGKGKGGSDGGAGGGKGKGGSDGGAGGGTADKKIPTWVWVASGVGGVAVLGLITYLAVRK